MPSRDVGGVAANCRGRQSAKWHARREYELLKLVAHQGSEETRELFLRMRLQGHHSPPEARQAAGRRAKPAPARARVVPKQKTAAQLAKSERDRERLRRKHLARVAKVAPKLQAWLRRARANLEQRRAPAPPATPTRPSVAVPESGADPPPFRAEVNTEADADPLAPATPYTYLSITKMDAYQDKSFEELRWEHYSEGNTLEAAEPPAADSARAAEPAAERGAGRRRQGKPRRLGAAGRPRVETRRACPHPPLLPPPPRAPSPPR